MSETTGNQDINTEFTYSQTQHFTYFYLRPQNVHVQLTLKIQGKSVHERLRVIVQTKTSQ